MPRRFLSLITSLFLLLLIFVLSACSNGGSTSPPATSTQPQSTPTCTQAHSKVGEQVTVGTTWLITVSSATLSSGDSSYTPPAGKQLLLVAINEKNQSNQGASVHGAADWSLHDGAGASFQVVKSDYGEMPVDSVAAGETANGELVYEVPTSTHQFTLTFAPTSGGSQNTWDISVGTQSQSTPTCTQSYSKVGEQVTVGTTWLITVSSATLSSGDNSYTPPAGKQLLVLAINEKNRSNQAASVHGAANWSLHDSAGASFQVVKSDYGEMPVDSVAAGETANGELVYEVPTSTHQFTLTFAPTSGSGQNTWAISV